MGSPWDFMDAGNVKDCGKALNKLRDKKFIKKQSVSSSAQEISKLLVARSCKVNTEGKNTPCSYSVFSLQASLNY